MEAIVAFVLSWWVFVPLCLIIGWVVHNEEAGWAMFLTVCSIAILCGILQLSVVTIGIGAIVYLPIGLVWSIWRWKRKVNYIVRQVQDGDMSSDRGREEVLVRNNLQNLVSWVIVWPFSVVESFIGDIVELVQIAVRNWFRSVYEKISNDAIQKIDSIK